MRMRARRWNYSLTDMARSLFLFTQPAESASTASAVKLPAARRVSTLCLTKIDNQEADETRRALRQLSASQHHRWRPGRICSLPTC